MAPGGFQEFISLGISSCDSVYSLAKATSELPVTQQQADELDLVSVIRSMDSSMNESAITHQPRIPPSDIGVCRDKSVRLPGLSDSFRGILLVARQPCHCGYKKEAVYTVFN